MKKIARGLGAILITPTAAPNIATNPTLLETGKIRAIMPNGTGEGAVVITNDTRNFKILVDESVDDIFDQQDVDGKNLGLIKVTIVGTSTIPELPLFDGMVVLIPTHTIERILPEGENRKIHLNTDGKIAGKHAVVVSETLSDIMAQQGNDKALGLLLVTRLVDKNLPDRPAFEAIYNWGLIEKIVADNTVGTAESRIIFCDPFRDIYVEETLATIYAAQPT